MLPDARLSSCMILLGTVCMLALFRRTPIEELLRCLLRVAFGVVTRFSAQVQIKTKGHYQ